MISDEFKRKKVVLHAKPLGDQRHTGNYLSEILDEMLLNWSSTKRQMYFTNFDYVFSIELKGYNSTYLGSHGAERWWVEPTLSKRWMNLSCQVLTALLICWIWLSRKVTDFYNLISFLFLALMLITVSFQALKSQQAISSIEFWSMLNACVIIFSYC